MDQAIVAAVAKAFEKQAKEGRDKLSVGVTKIDAVVSMKIQGTVSVSKDTEATPTTSIPMKAAFALFIKYSGITGQPAIDALMKAMTEALTLDEDAEKEILATSELAVAMSKVTEGLAKLPKVKKLGAVKVAVVVSDTSAIPATTDPVVVSAKGAEIA